MQTNRTVLLIAACAIAVCLLYWCSADRIYDHDCFLFGVASRGLLEHKVLYKTTYDNKPPFTILFFVFPQLIAKTSWPVMQICFGIWIVLQSLLLILLLRKYNLTASLLAGLVMALLPLTRAEFIWPSSEHLSNTFVLLDFILAYVIWRESNFSLAQCFIAGAATCAGFHCRQTALIAAVVPAFAVAAAPSTVRCKLAGIAAGAAGFLIIFLVAAGTVVWLGDWNGYIYTVFVYPSLYAGAVSFEFLLAMGAGFLSMLAPLLVLSLAPEALASRYRWFVLAAGLISIVMALAPLRPYYHYLASLLPFLAIVFFIFLDVKGAVVTSRKVKAGVAAGVTAFVLFAALNNVILAVVNPNAYLLTDVAAEIDKISGKDDTLFVVGDHGACVYYFAHIPPANMYFAPMLLDPPWSAILPEKIEAVLAQYRSRPPTVLTVHTNLLGLKTRLNSLNLVDEYLRSGAYSIAAEKNGWTIFKRAAPAP